MDGGSVGNVVGSDVGLLEVGTGIGLGVGASVGLGVGTFDGDSVVVSVVG